MKKLVLALSLLTAVASADACCYRNYYHGGGYYHPYGWVAPALVGGVIGYELAQPRTVIVEQQPPIVIQQPSVQLSPPPVGYHYQQMVNPQTGQYQLVLVPN